MKEFDDLTGKIFGKWEVLSQAEDKLIGKRKTHKRAWECICHCGFCGEVKRDVNESNLKGGRSTSCGKEAKLKKGKNRKYNTYDLTGEYGIGYTLKSEEYYFDLEDYDKIKPYFWYVHDDKTNKYMRAYKETLGGKHVFIFMHNIVMNNDLKDGKIVDHILGNTLDNRKNEMRICKRIENIKNSRMFSNNTSGYKGVHYSKLQNQWIAYISCDNVKIHLGTFTYKKDAVAAREKAEIKYFGEFNREVI